MAESVAGAKEIRTMDAMDEWTEWNDAGEADWWLKYPLHRPKHERTRKTNPR